MSDFGIRRSKDNPSEISVVTSDADGKEVTLVTIKGGMSFFAAGAVIQALINEGDKNSGELVRFAAERVRGDA